MEKEGTTMTTQIPALVALNKLAKSFWNDHVSYLGNDDEMAEWAAQDRNDVLDVKSFLIAGDTKAMAAKIEELDTCMREAIVIAMIDDMGKDFVLETTGYYV